MYETHHIKESAVLLRKHYNEESFMRWTYDGVVKLEESARKYIVVV